MNCFLKFGVLRLCLAEWFEGSKCLRRRTVESGCDFEWSGFRHRSAITEAGSPIADAEHVRSRHRAPLHEMTHAVEALAFASSMAQAGFGIPLQINVAPKEPRRERHDLRSALQSTEEMRRRRAGVSGGQGTLEVRIRQRRVEGRTP